MKHLSAVVVALLAVASVSAQESPTLKKIADSNSITLGYRESSVPFSYLDNGKPVGFSYELCNKIADNVKKTLNKPNLEVKYQAVTSQNRIPLIQNGTVDVECGSTTNNSARGQQVAFAINHFYTGTRLLAKKSSNIKNYSDLKDQTVSSTTGTTNYQVIQKYNREKNLDMKIIAGKDHDDSMLLVDGGRAVAFAMDDILLYGLRGNAKNPAEWEVVGDALQVEPYAFMVRKDDPVFKKLVDDTLTQSIKSGDFERLYKKWFQSPIPPKNVNLNVPMSQELRDNLKNLSDKPAL